MGQVHGHYDCPIWTDLFFWLLAALVFLFHAFIKGVYTLISSIEMQVFIQF